MIDVSDVIRELKQNGIRAMETNLPGIDIVCAAPSRIRYFTFSEEESLLSRGKKITVVESASEILEALGVNG